MLWFLLILIALIEGFAQWSWCLPFFPSKPNGTGMVSHGTCRPQNTGPITIQTGRKLMWLHLRNSQKRRKWWYSREKWPILMICLCLFGGPMGSPVLRTSQLDSKSQKIRHPQSATAESPLFEANSLEKQNLRVINKVSSRFCVYGWLVWASLSSVKQHDRGYKP